MLSHSYLMKAPASINKNYPGPTGVCSIQGSNFSYSEVQTEHELALTGLLLSFTGVGIYAMCGHVVISCSVREPRLHAADNVHYGKGMEHGCRGRVALQVAKTSQPQAGASYTAFAGYSLGCWI